MRQEAKKEELEKKNRSTIEKLENLHPYQTLLYLGIGASGLVFLFMIIAFSVRVWSSPLDFPLGLPKYFTLSTIILLFSGFRTSRLIKAYDVEDIHEIARNLQIILILGMAFTVSQVMGWLDLYNSQLSFQKDLSAAYLYVISGLHMLHLIGGLLFLGYLNYIVVTTRKDVVKQLVFFTNKFQRLRLSLLSIYWRFLDLSWLVLFVWFFLIF